MSSGNILYDLRVEKNLKQGQIAYDLEISQSTYCDWENSISKPKRENLRKLAEYFKVDIKNLEDEIYKSEIKNKKDTLAIASINSSNAKINSTEAILKIVNSLEKLTLLVEKLIAKSS